MEIWKRIPGYGGYYEASSQGRIRSIDRLVTKRDRHTGKEMVQEYKGRVLNPSIQSKKGYVAVHISVNNKKTTLPVHHAILFAFVGMPEASQEACHNNGIANDNRPENLRWDTHSNNNKDRIRHGTYATGEKHAMAVLNNKTALNIYKSNERGRVLAKRIGISETTISKIRLGKIWASVTGGVPRFNVNTYGPTPNARNQAKYGTQAELLALTIERLK